MTNEQKRKYKVSNEYKDHRKKYRKDMTDEQKQKNRDYQKEYYKKMTDEQKQKLKDYQKEYYKKYYIEKMLNNKNEK